jgi:KamA family protein
MDDNDEVSLDVSEGMDYIRSHPAVTNVLLTGGDPLLMSTRRIREILAELRSIPHVRIIRIGSKMPAFDPFRVLGDAALQDTLREFSTPHGRIYLMAHFDHPRELTDAAVEGIDAFIKCGVMCVNQCPLIKGINDDPDVLAEMYQKLAWIGCPPYYLFQGRPTAGNEPYEVPLVRGWHVFREALRRGSGLARRARFVMSHETGKLEILAVDDEHIYLRYHRAKDEERRGLVLAYRRDDAASWFDQLEPVSAEARRLQASSLPAGSEGPE